MKRHDPKSRILLICQIKNFHWENK